MLLVLKTIASGKYFFIKASKSLNSLKNFLNDFILSKILTTNLPSLINIKILFRQIKYERASNSSLHFLLLSDVKYFANKFTLS